MNNFPFMSSAVLSSSGKNVKNPLPFLLMTKFAKIQVHRIDPDIRDNWKPYTSHESESLKTNSQVKSHFIVKSKLQQESFLDFVWNSFFLRTTKCFSCRSMFRYLQDKCFSNYFLGKFLMVAEEFLPSHCSLPRGTALMYCNLLQQRAASASSLHWWLY